MLLSLRSSRTQTDHPVKGRTCFMKCKFLYKNTFSVGEVGQSCQAQVLS
jgi:hypothetical protein